MPDDIDNILKNSTKAEFIEAITEALKKADKAVVIFIEDKENGEYTSDTMTLGLNTSYEAYGILEVAKQDLAGGEELNG